MKKKTVAPAKKYDATLLTPAQARAIESEIKEAETMFKQYRDKTRKSDIMNAIAGSLTDAEINDIAHYYGSVKP
jgi:cytochrome c553